MFIKIVNKFKITANFQRIFNFRRHFSANTEPSKRPALVLGIETSCDDTGCAIVNSNGQILGEDKYSQLQFHLRTGGINPVFLNELHRFHIENVVCKALQQANVTVADVDAIAVTNRPGIGEALIIGIRYAKHLARKYAKPLIPIHHMEAHALTARMECPQLQFPFLCLLASGGHCQLALVRNVTDFILLGESLDSAPGTCFDRVARALRLQLLPGYEHFSGGKAIEMAAYNAINSEQFSFNIPLNDQRNCQFSFDGLRGHCIHGIQDIRNRLNIAPDEMIPLYENFCASLLKIVTRHMLQRTQRAIYYCDRIGAFGYGANKMPKAFVFAGGVACNDFIYKALSQMVYQLGFESYRCSKRLCSDNGVMIAWNGIERWRDNENFYRNLDIDTVIANCYAKLGVDQTKEVAQKHLKCDWVKVPCMEAATLSPN